MKTAVEGQGKALERRLIRLYTREGSERHCSAWQPPTTWHRVEQHQRLLLLPVLSARRHGAPVDYGRAGAECARGARSSVYPLG